MLILKLFFPIFSFWNSHMLEWTLVRLSTTWNRSLYKPFIVKYFLVDNLCRSSHRRCFVKKCFLEKIEKSTRKHLWWSFFFNKAAVLKSRDSDTGFFLHFAKFCRTPFLQNTSERLLLSLPKNEFTRIYFFSCGKIVMSM